MFVLSKLRDSVRLSPSSFSRPLDEAVIDELNRKYCNKVVLGLGLCVCLFDLLEHTDPLVVPGDGCIHLKAVFRLIVFRPFIGEIMTGRVRACTEESLRVSTLFFDDIFVLSTLMQPNSSFDNDERLWVWAYQEQHKLYMDIDEPIRFRIHEEFFNDTMPPALIQDTTATTGGGGGGGPAASGASNGVAGAVGSNGGVAAVPGAASAASNGGASASASGDLLASASETTLAKRTAAHPQQSPYRIHANIQEDGLGLTQWWK